MILGLTATTATESSNCHPLLEGFYPTVGVSIEPIINAIIPSLVSHLGCPSKHSFTAMMLNIRPR